MILKSMNVECNKTDMDNYAAEVDEEETGKFTFVQFCSVRSEMDVSTWRNNLKEGVEIYSKNIAHIRGFGSWCWITGGFGPCEASLRAPDLGGGVGGGPVEDHLQAATVNFQTLWSIGS